MRILILLSLLVSYSVQAHQAPIGERERLGFNLGIQKEIILDRLDIDPVGLSSSEIAPPLLTLKGSYQPNYMAIFQPDINLAFSVVEGDGQYLYLQAGAWFDFPKFHLFLGGELLSSLSGGDYGGSPIDHFGFGGYIKGGMPLGMFYPSLEIRHRRIRESEIAKREGLTTYIDHKGDTLIRPSLNVDLNIIKLWCAITYYRIGNTAIASDGFGIGIEGDPFFIYSAGAGFSLGETHFWFKVHHLEGIEDELAHFYQVPQIYPDLLVAKQSASLEIQWQF